MSKLRNLSILALVLLVCLQAARLVFLWQFGSLSSLLSEAGQHSFYIGLKFDLRLIALMLMPAWLLLRPGTDPARGRWQGALVLALALVVYVCVVVIGSVDDRGGRPWLLGFLLLTIVYHTRCREHGLSSGREVRWIWGAYSLFVVGFVLLAFATDFGSFSYNRVRLNGTVLVFLQNPLISAQMIWQSYPVIPGVLAIALLIAALLWLFGRLRGWQPLPLARGHLRAALADHRAEAERQARHEGSEAGSIGGPRHLLVAGLGARVADVLGDGRVQQRRFLLDEHDVPADVLEPQRAQVVAVEADDPVVWIEQPQQQERQRRLAAAAGTHQRDRCTRRHAQRHLVEHRQTALGAE